MQPVQVDYTRGHQQAVQGTRGCVGVPFTPCSQNGGVHSDRQQTPTRYLGKAVSRHRGGTPGDSPRCCCGPCRASVGGCTREAGTYWDCWDCWMGNRLRRESSMGEGREVCVGRSRDDREHTLPNFQRAHPGSWPDLRHHRRQLLVLMKPVFWCMSMDGNQGSPQRCKKAPNRRTKMMNRIIDARESTDNRQQVRTPNKISS